MKHKTTISQIEEVIIMQIRALDSGVSVEAAHGLSDLKLHLINQYHNEQLLKKAEALIRPGLFQRIVYKFRR